MTPPPSGDAPQTAAVPRFAPAPLWTGGLIVALLAGGLSWRLGERYIDYYKPSEEAAEAAYDFTQLNIEEKQAGSRNTAIAYGLFGGILGAALGALGGLLGRSPKRAGILGVAGLLLGALAGAAPPFLIFPLYYDHMSHPEIEFESYFLPLTVLMHTGLWCPLGAVAGGSLAVGLKGLRGSALLKGILGGLLGALIGAVLYNGIGAFAFPLDNTTYPVSTTPITRLLARIVVAISIVATAIVAGSSSSASARKPSSPDHV